jgi:hypothetical protein
MQKVAFPYVYMPLSSEGKPVALGKIYIGEPNQDPVLPANQKPLEGRMSDGTKFTLAQPVLTNAGGVAVHNNEPIEILVDGDHSIKILDKSDQQVYYVQSSFDFEQGANFQLFDKVWTDDSTVTNAYELSRTEITNPDEYLDGSYYYFYAANDATLTQPVTIDIAGIGVKDLKKFKGTADLKAGDMTAGHLFCVVYIEALDVFSLENPHDIAIGDLHITTTTDNPATSKGYGIWTRFGEGRMLLGESGGHANGTTGGAETHTLTAAQMPTHSHGVSDPGHTHTVASVGNTGSGSSGALQQFDGGNIATNTGSSTTGISLGSTGGGQPHNNMPPFITVMTWKRTA